MENNKLKNQGFKKISTLLMDIWQNPGATETYIIEITKAINSTERDIIQNLQKVIIGTIHNILINLQTNSESKNIKYLIVDLLRVVFDKIDVDELGIFFFAHNFLLEEIYDYQQPNTVAKISEEYKLIIMQAMTSIAKALTRETTKLLYTKENALLLCKMLYVTIEIAKIEQLRSLRCSAIECIMALAKVDDNSNLADTEIRNQVADVFMFFVPGIISGLAKIVTEDEKIGHKVTLLAIRAWGRIIALQMQNYSISDTSTPFPISKEPTNKTSYKDAEEIKKYLTNTKLDSAWYKSSDSKVQAMMTLIVKLTNHSHTKVRLELADSCLLLTELCACTIPSTIGKAIEILIILLEDEDEEVSKRSSSILTKFPNQLSLNTFNSVLDNLEDNFFAAVNSLPRIFNGLDEQEQLSSLNSVIGYLRIFGKTNLTQLLHSSTHLNSLIQTLLQISEVDTKNIGLQEEYMIQDLELIADHHTPWKNFRFIRNEKVEERFETLCKLLAKCDVLEMISDLLMDVFINSNGNRKECTLILNSALLGVPENNIDDNMHIIRSVIETYLDPEYWNIPIEVNSDCTIPEAQNNVIQICLQIEGLSRIALKLKIEFRNFLLKALYPILESAGSTNPLIKRAGTTAIVNVSSACGYSSVTELLNMNSDYFSFHIKRKMQKRNENERVLNVLSAVMKNCDVEVLPSISDIVSDALLETCDKFFQERNANAYLQVFQIFIKCVTRWFSITIVIKPIKSKKEKEIEHEDFKLSNLNEQEEYNDEKKSAGELYKEDLEQQKLEENSDYDPFMEDVQKVKPPNYVQLTVQVLQRCLNFLPSKNQTRKLLVLGILKDGLEIIKEWEDNLLPLVHHIWSPLVDRFKERNEPLILNRSFELLITLARLSKDFIRSRTAKEVLPQVTTVLQEYSKKSYLQDRGASYRYTQGYKMQLNILEHLARVVIDLDLGDNHINAIMKCVIVYLSNKQPHPLQQSTFKLFQELAVYDEELVIKMLKQLSSKESENQNSETIQNMNLLLKKIFVKREPLST